MFYPLRNVPSRYTTYSVFTELLFEPFTCLSLCYNFPNNRRLQKIFLFYNLNKFRISLILSEINYVFSIYMILE